MVENSLVAGSLYREIRKRILSGLYLPGTVLRQQDIAEQFDTSRVPLREAFSKLEAEGFLILRPQRGYAVASLTPADITEIFNLRAVLERHAGQLATRMQRNGDAQAVDALIEELAGASRNGVSDIDHWCRVSRELQERMLECCQSPRLQQMVQQLRDLVELYIRMELNQTRDVTEIMRDYEEIAAGFKSGDADLVGELWAVHCSRTAQRLLANLPSLSRG